MIRRLLGDRLTGSAIALMMTTGITSLLGLVFWAAAARLYPSDSVGRASAEIAAATLLAGVAQLNLVAVFMRFVPGAGRRTRRFVIHGYLLTGVLAVLLTLGLVAAGFGRAYVGDSLLERCLFLVAVLVFLANPLGDSLLTALRRSGLVLLESTLFAVLKLVLLIAVATAVPELGIILAWVIPNVVLLLAFGVYLFAVVIPRHEREHGSESRLPPGRQLASFVSAEYLKSLLTFVAAQALPLVVAQSLGLTATAHFAIPWLITTSVNLLLYNVSSSFVVEAQFDKENYPHLLRRSMQIGGAVTVAATAVQFLGAPYLLGVLGTDYAAEGTALMQILAISLPFGALNALYSTFAWMEARLWRLLVLQAVNVVILLGGSALLLGSLGINGVGMAFLASQVVLGLGSVPPIVRRLRAAVPRGHVEVTPVHHDLAGIALEVHEREPD